MRLQVEIQDLRMMLKEKCEEIIADKSSHTNFIGESAILKKMIDSLL